jgi:predicted RND superfamily exporter protein
MQKLTAFYINLLLRRPLLLMGFGVFLFLSFVPGLFLLRKDFSFRQLTSPTDPHVVSYDLYEKHFGNDDGLVFIIEKKQGIFNLPTLKIIKQLRDDVLKIPRATRLDSLFEGSTIQSTEESIEIKGLINPDQIDSLTENDLIKMKQKALETPQIKSYLISEDTTVAFVRVYVPPTAVSGGDYYEFAQSAENLIKDYQKKYPDYRFLIAGTAYINKTFIEVSKTDQMRLFPFTLLIFAVVAFWFFKSMKGVFLTMSMVMLNILMTLGIQGYFGYAVNGFTASIGLIISTIATAGVIHILESFFHEYNKSKNTESAVIYSFSKNFYTTFFTSFTTTIGFFTLSNKDLMPLFQIGMVIGCASFLSWILNMILLGPFLVWFHRKNLSGQIPEIRPEDLVLKGDSPRAKKYVAFIRKYSWPIIIIWVIAFLGVFPILPKLEVRVNPFSQFSKNLPVVTTKDFIKEKMGFSIFMELMFNSGNVDGAKKIDYLKRVEAFDNDIKKDPLVIKTIGLLDFVKEMNKTFNADKKEYFRLPDTDEAVSQFLLLFSFSDASRLNSFLSPDGQFLRSSLYINLEESNLILAKVDEIEKKAKSYGLDLKVTGKLPLFMSLGPKVFDVLIGSAFWSILSIGLSMIFVLRSLRFGILSMIPNVIPILMAAYIVYFMDWGIDIGTTFVFSICLGIAVDDTIHFTHHYYQARSQGHSVDKALEIIFSHVSSSLFATTFILAFGFGVMYFADFLPNQKFGTLTCIVLILALLSELMLLPAILIQDKRDPKIKKSAS